MTPVQDPGFDYRLGQACNGDHGQDPQGAVLAQLS